MNSTDSTRWRRLFALCVTLLTALPTFAASANPFTAFDTVDPSTVLIAAHRGGYMSNGAVTHAENSISAITNSISLGVDILEIDIRMTSDGGLVAMHDTTVNRTTNGSGTVSAMTLAQVTALQLKGAGGTLTNEYVPTFAEVMTAAKGKALVNLDKVDINNIAMRDAIMTVLQATDTVDHAIFKGGASAAQVNAFKTAYSGETIHYMPILNNASEATMISTMNDRTPPAAELIFNSDTTGMLSDNSRAAATAADSHIWINSLWSSLCAGHHDAVALGGNPDGSWGWLVDNGATIIQTDNAPQLLAYLESRNTPPGPAPAPATVYNYDDGTLQGWTNNAPADSTSTENFVASNSVSRVPGQSGSYAMVEGDFDNRDASDTSVKVLTSEAFGLTETSDISVFLNGGVGATDTPSWTNYADMQDTADSNGFMGIALRRLSDDEYVLFDRKDASNQYAAGWEEHGWDATALSALLLQDGADELYVIDLIDTFSGSWGWIGMDSVTLTSVVPEPATMSLLALGGMAMLKRRKK